MTNTMSFQDYLSMAISLGLSGGVFWVLCQPWCL